MCTQASQGSVRAGRIAIGQDFDQIAQGMGGLMSVTGLPGQGPMRVGVPYRRSAAGLFCAIWILTALLEREKSGEGQCIETSLLEAQIFMSISRPPDGSTGGEVPGQAGNNHPTSIPTGVFKTADGYINIATTGQVMWERLARAIGAAALLQRPEFETSGARLKNRDALNAALEEYTSAQPSSTGSTS